MNPKLATTATVVTGSAFGQQLSVLLLWWLEAVYSVKPTTEQAVSMSMVVGAVCGFLAPVISLVVWGLLRRAKFTENGS